MSTAQLQSAAIRGYGSKFAAQRAGKRQEIDSTRDPIPATANQSSKPRTLSDAFKQNQNGVKLCEGTKLNCVGKRVQRIGRVPPAIAAHVTALYLSQNDLSSLEGIDQFASVQLLSIGGNVLTRFSEVHRLTALRLLRHLNLTGNPICEFPSYRHRVMHALPSVRVLDGVQVTKKDRELARVTASQDHVYRQALVRNHVLADKLQRLVVRLRLHREFYSLVLTMTSVSNQFDQLPRIPDASSDRMSVLQRVWDASDVLSDDEQETIEVQLLGIVVRAYRQLCDHPKTRASTYLMQLAANSKQPGKTRVRVPFTEESKQWAEAYSQVLALQQQRVVDLESEGKRERNATVEHLKTMLTTDPTRRRWLIKSSMAAMPTRGVATKIDLSSKLPPQQVDPETMHPKSPCQHTARSIIDDQQPRGNKQQERESISVALSPKRSAKPGPKTQAKRQSEFKSKLRFADFNNKTLNEAVNQFRLRDDRPQRAQLRDHGGPRPQAAAPSNAWESNNQVRVMTLQVPSPRSHPMASMDSQPNQVIKTSNELAIRRGDQSSHQSHGRPALLQSRTVVDDQHEDDIDAMMDDEAMSDYSDFTEVSSLGSRSYSHQSDRRPSSSHRSVSTQAASLRPIPETVEDAGARPTTVASSSSPPTVSATEDSLVVQTRQRNEELEQREEKYIQALMASEQRELDLRNQLQQVVRKLSHTQQTMALEQAERAQIRRQMTERAEAIARPKILRRFFQEWMSFLQWHYQLQHIRRKRLFILKHDRLQQWQRWVQRRQRFQQLQTRTTANRLRSFFREWTMSSRLAVIARFARFRRHKRMQRQVFCFWRQWYAQQRSLAQAMHARHQSQGDNRKREVFHHWRRYVRLQLRVSQFEDKHEQARGECWKRLAFRAWNLYVVAYARPLAARHEQYRSERRRRQVRRIFAQWAEIAHHTRSQRRTVFRWCFKRWTSWIAKQRADRVARSIQRRSQLQRSFQEWRSVAQERISLCRSLSLARRFMYQRRLRKLWWHWKCYSRASRRHRQGNSKALKHYFMHLLRQSWGKWRHQAHDNIQHIKAQKQTTLRKYFLAFKEGIHTQRLQHARLKFIEHHRLRVSFRVQRQTLRAWHHVVCARKRSKCCATYISKAKARQALTMIWQQWRGKYVGRLHHHLRLQREKCSTIVDEKHDVEDRLLSASDQSISLAEQVSAMRTQLNCQHQKLVRSETQVQEQKEQQSALQNEFGQAQRAWERERKDWRKAVSKLESAQEQSRLECARVEEELERVKADNKALMEQKHKLTAQCDAQVSDCRRLHEEAKQMERRHEQELHRRDNQQQALQRQLVMLQQQLQNEQAAREETAVRLQEYEQRIITTCGELNEHEQQQERELVALRHQQQHFERQWKEEHVRTMALQRLLQEKGDMILSLQRQLQQTQSTMKSNPPAPDSASITASQWREPRGLEGLLEEVQRTIHERSQQQLAYNTAPHHPLPTNDPNPSRSTASRQVDILPIPANAPANEEPKLVTGVTQTNGPTVSDQDQQNAASEVKRLEEQTSKIHRDICELQDRLTQKLQESPTKARCTTVAPLASRITSGYIGLRSPLATSSTSTRSDGAPIARPKKPAKKKSRNLNNENTSAVANTTTSRTARAHNHLIPSTASRARLFSSHTMTITKKTAKPLKQSTSSLVPDFQASSRDGSRRT